MTDCCEEHGCTRHQRTTPSRMPGGCTPSGTLKPSCVARAAAMSDSPKPTDTMSDIHPTCPKRNMLGNGTRCINPPGHDGDCDFPGGLNPEPRAAHPWRVTLCWTPDQNFGRLSVFPSRAPVFAVWDLLAAGEDLSTAAVEHGLSEEQVRVLDLLRRELLAPDPDGDDAGEAAL